MVYTVTLNPAVDYVMNINAESTGGIFRCDGDNIHCGGKGINVSLVLKQLCVESTALGFIAGFTGDELERRLKDGGLECRFLRLENGMTRINVKLHGAHELGINAMGPEVEEKNIDALLCQLDILQNGDYLVLSGSAPKGVKADIYESMLKRVEGKGVKAVVDAEGALFLNSLKYKPFLVKPNHHELGALFGESADTNEAVEHLAKRLQALGAANVLVSRAEKGAMLLTENGDVLKSENAKGNAVNSVGCGDSMLAGFLAGYIKAGDYEHALKLGTACGNAAAFSMKLPTKGDIEKLIQR